MRDDADDAGDDLQRLLQAIADRAETAGVGELARDWRRRISDQVGGAEEPWMKIIQAVGELLSAFPVPGDSAGREHTAGPGDQQAQPVTAELIENPTGEAQYQSLTMLAALIRWLSRESGRSEAELLDELAANATNL